MAFKANPRAAETLEAAVREELFAVASKIAGKAGELAPDGTSSTARNPAYASRFSYKVRFIDGRFIIRSTDPNAHIVEFGSIRSPEYAPLRRAIRSLGLQLNDFGPGGTSRRRGVVREFSDG